MDPISVLKTLWRHKWAALPMALLTIIACVYVMFFAQRTYEATMTYALLSPKTPTEAELRAQPELAAINGDNPYLRSGDRALLAQVLITKLGAQETAEQLTSLGLGAEYTVGQSLSSGSGMLARDFGVGRFAGPGGGHRDGTRQTARHDPARSADHQRRGRQLSLFRPGHRWSGPSE